MAKKQIEFVQVDALTARISLSVSGGTEGKPDFVPDTDGFMIEVRYSSEAQKMGKALASTKIDVQNILRVFYRANKRFPFQPGKLQKVDGTGSFELPVSSQVDRLEAQLERGEVELVDKIRLARKLGFAIPQEWLDELSTLQAQQASDEADVEVAEEVDEMKYDEAELTKLSITKLRKLAQDEELEGYDSLDKAQLVEELSLVYKEV